MPTSHREVKSIYKFFRDDVGIIPYKDKNLKFLICRAGVYSCRKSAFFTLRVEPSPYFYLSVLVFLIISRTVFMHTPIFITDTAKNIR